jgi:hypothetical protein
MEVVELMDGNIVDRDGNDEDDSAVSSSHHFLHASGV